MPVRKKISPRKSKPKRGISPSAFAFMPRTVERAFEGGSSSSKPSSAFTQYDAKARYKAPRRESQQNRELPRQGPELTPSTPFSEDQMMNTPSAPMAPNARRWESVEPHNRPTDPVHFDHTGMRLESLRPNNPRMTAGELPDMSSRQREAFAFQHAHSGSKPHSVNIIRRSVLSKDNTWDGNLDSFDEFKDTLPGHYM